MSVWDELKDKAGEVAGTVSEKISEFADTAGTEYSVLKIKRAISLLEAEIGEIEGAMGKRVYELHRHKKIDDKELQTRCFEIDGLRKRIHENEDEIERLRKEAEERGEVLKEEEVEDEKPEEDDGTGKTAVKDEPADD